MSLLWLPARRCSPTSASPRAASSPLVALVAVCSLALGISAVVTVLSWVEGAVVRPFPLVRDPERLVEVRLLAAVALAGWLPARRAARVDPVEALRAE